MLLFFSGFIQLRNREVSALESLKPLTLLFILLLPACTDSTETAATDAASQHAIKHLQQKYVCPMHPKIVREQEASCPICGMDLVKKKAKQSNKERPVLELGAEVVQKLGVKSERVEKGRLFKYIKTVGYVSYDEKRLSTIVAQADGWVENLGIRRAGLEVRKGQLLMELYSPDFLKVQKQFIQLQKKDKSGVLKKYDQRQESTELRDELRYMGVADSLVNEIARTGKPRHRIPVYATQHGNVIRHNVSKRQYVSEGYAMFTIADLSSVWIEANVYEHQLSWIKRKQNAEVSVQALPGKRWKGIVTYIFPELDARTRTLKVRIRVPNYDSQLKPNMFAQVEIFGGAKQQVLNISRQALIVTGSRESVILDLGNGRFKPVDVVSGMKSGGKVEILSGLKEADRVVTSGQFLIDSEANLQSSFERF
ncbi:MAG: efflux RND transporter periplasmic adaptor subunit [Gammaproteobacteria bacterium]|nr:efflux RND transporter periplasmic adaptor subunit [Gammaproteobacteria bacterium]